MDTMSFRCTPLRQGDIVRRSEDRNWFCLSSSLLLHRVARRYCGIWLVNRASSKGSYVQCAFDNFCRRTELETGDKVMQVNLGFHMSESHPNTDSWAGRKREHIRISTRQCRNSRRERLPSFGSEAEQVSTLWSLDLIVTYLNSQASSPHIARSILLASKGI